MNEVQKWKEHALFSGLSCEEIGRIWKCFHFMERHYRKNEYLMMEGDEVRLVGIIVSGDILLEKEDVSGEGCFVLKLQAGELFGDMFIGEQIHKSTVNYRALSDCEVVVFQYRTFRQEREAAVCRLRDGGGSTKGAEAFGHICDCHLRFVENLTGLLAGKTRQLLARVEILSAPLLRKRILTCLRIMGERQGKKDPETGACVVELPFHKTELAEFLCVNRSALMRELSKMKQDGILRCEGNRYLIPESETGEA